MADYCMLARALRVLGVIWFVLTALIILIGYGTILYQKGLRALQEMLSPFNVLNWIVTLIALAPALSLFKLAEAVGRKNRASVLKALGAFLVVLVIFAGLLYVGLGDWRGGRERATQSQSRDYRATAVRVRNDSAMMYAHKNYYITQTSGSVGKEGIPENIKLGDIITVKGRTIKARHIVVSEAVVEMKWKGEVLAKPGDVTCVIVESEENLPYGDESRDRLWIYVKQCEPVSRE